MVQPSDDYEPLPHIQRALRSSECRTPIMCFLPEGDPFQSLVKLAAATQSTVWHIEMGNDKNEQNAIDYVDVGIQNGDWVYITNVEEASSDTLRSISKTLVTLAPEPKRFPRREFFRIWFGVAKEFDINDNMITLPRLLLQNAIVARGKTKHEQASPTKWCKKLPEVSELLVAEVVKHHHRREAGRDSDSESDAEEAEKKITGMWFHRAVDFHALDSGSSITKASEEIYVAIDDQDSEKIRELCRSGQLDLNRLRRAGMSPLQYACSAQKTVAAKALLEAGADPNIPRDSDGCPPLFMTLEDEDLVRALLDAGADPAVRFEGNKLEHHPTTAPHIAKLIREIRAADAATTTQINLQSSPEIGAVPSS
jgi:hypothetical protein